MKRFILSAASLIAAVSMASVLASTDPVLTITVDNSKAPSSTYSVMRIGPLKICSTTTAPATQGGKTSSNEIKQSELEATCLSSTNCSIQLMENTQASCKDATVIGTVNINPSNIGGSGALLSGATQPNNWSYQEHNNNEVDITTNK